MCSSDLQDKCRGWRMCVSGCPYKKIYYNWSSGKSEKCIFCYPRIEAGQPTVCSETCVGRIRYLGVVLYDADRIEEAASAPNEQDLYEAQLRLFMNPHDEAVIAQARADGIPDAWLEAARRSPIWKMAMEWKVAFPLHPEYRTLPMVWYIPPLSPIKAAAEAGCARIVYTSTVGCIGLPREVDGRITPTDESTPVAEAQMSNPYKLSKWRAEVVARELAARGAPVVIVNPSAPVGPRDVKPTPTGKVIVDFLNRAMPAYLDTGLNWVHVRDVAVGHIVAAEKGRIGERYILGSADGNWTMKQALEVLGEISGLPAPRFQVPYAVALAAAHVDEFVARFTSKPPKAPLAGVRMARYKMFFNPAKAIRELGLPQTPARQALADAVAWFRANGYVRQ